MDEISSGHKDGCKTWKHFLMVESMSSMLTIIYQDIQLRIHREQMRAKTTDWQIMCLAMMGEALNVGNGKCAKGRQRVCVRTDMMMEDRKFPNTPKT